jgi:hypothetical protein
VADRNHDALEILGRNKRVVAISWAPDSANPVTDVRVNEGAATVVWTSTGTFTVTFADKYVSLLAAVPMLQLASADDKFPQVGSYDASARTLVVRVLDNNAGTIAVADVAANANNRVGVICVFDDALHS